MKKMMHWVLAVTLVCGTSVMTSCSNDNSDNAGSIEQAKKNRKEFVAHTRQNLKTLAENLNFSTWNSVNYFNQYLNEYVLLNDNFDKTLSRTVGMEAQKSIRPLPAEDVALFGWKSARCPVGAVRHQHHRPRCRAHAAGHHRGAPAGPSPAEAAGCLPADEAC